MLRLLSDIPQAPPWRTFANGVAATNSDRYFSCSIDEVVSEVDTVIKQNENVIINLYVI